MKRRLVNDGVRLEQTCILDFAYTKVGFASKFATKVCEECCLRMFARNHLTPTFVHGFLKKSTDILSNLVFKGIKAVVLCVLIMS